MTFIIIVIGFAARILVATWNGFFGPSFGAELDALTFHFQAVEHAKYLYFEEIGIGNIFIVFLGLFYRLTIDSLFLGSLLSCVVWLSSVLILKKCMHLLSIEKGSQCKVLLIYCLLPSSVMLTAVTLREPYQLFFVNLMAYAFLKICLHKSTKSWFTLGFSIAGASLLHGALLAFGVVFLVGVVSYVLMRGKRISLIQLAGVGVFGGFVIWLGASLFVNAAYNLDGGLVNSLEFHQEALLSADARSSYKSDVVISGLSDMPTFVIFSIFQYLFEPLPWRVATLNDGIIFIENMIRAWLIWAAYKSLRSAQLLQKRTMFFMMASYFALEAIWAVGTTNWGTAARHHIPALGLLLLTAYAYSGLKVVKMKSTLKSAVSA
jgi:hypothetical protein